MKKSMKVFIAIPARNSEKTLEKVYYDIPIKFRKNVLLSDDGSRDSTIDVAKKLGIKVFKNPRKHGYGSNAKNCFNKALGLGADIVIILHSDYQYDAKKIPDLVKYIENGKADFTIGSRILGDKAEGMSAFRFLGNRLLGFIENLIMRTKVTDLHSGLVAVSSDLLKRIPFNVDSDDFGFHTDMVFQAHYANGKFKEVGIPTRYGDASSSISIYKSIVYGFHTLDTIFKYLMAKSGLMKHPKFRIKKIDRKN
ncbi:glycosyl transferase family 2 [Candidatus Woesearchaeota archaeon]|nr:glycosyl transferase family 2 [Candidatus Woesearchaeota archaeon]MDP6647829.1 glycosyltransferase family 2 protein [Candidatus Woesearchaeota archaeon]